jgi:hypothetical protein
LDPCHVVLLTPLLLLLLFVATAAGYCWQLL